MGFECVIWALSAVPFISLDPSFDCFAFFGAEGSCGANCERAFFFLEELGMCCYEDGGPI